jgi:hypothetical protein
MNREQERMIHPMPSLRTAIRPWTVVTLLCLLYSLLVVLQNNGDALALVTIGTRFSEAIPASVGGTEGYDGQFVYYIARDPSTAAAYIDVPAYRFQRILLPLLGRALSFGQANLIPWALLLVNLVSLAIGTNLMERLLSQHNASRWYALGYGLSIGTFGSVRLSLSEPLAYALVLGGIVVAEYDRWLRSALLFALAALAKETTLLFVAGYVFYWLYQRRWQRAFVFGLIAVIPFIVWQFVLYDHFGTFGVGAGGALATNFEVVPCAGVIRILIVGGLLGLIVFGPIICIFAITPTIWALLRCWRDFRLQAWSLYTSLLIANAAVMPFVPFSTYREPLGILRFIVGLQIAIILYAAWKPAPRAMRNTTLWATTILFILVLRT